MSEADRAKDGKSPGSTDPVDAREAIAAEEAAGKPARSPATSEAAAAGTEPAAWPRLVEAHYHFQTALYQPRRTAAGAGEWCWHEALGEPDWNHARLPSGIGSLPSTREPLDSWLDRVEAVGLELGRAPIVAVTPGSPRGLVERLAARGWSPRFRHRWALWQGGDPSMLGRSGETGRQAAGRTELEATVAGEVRVRTVRSKGELESFLGVFFEGFAPASRVGPRCLLEMEADFEPGWRLSIEASSEPDTDRDFEVRHYLAELEGEPAGVATAFLGTRGPFRGIAGFYNLAVRPSFRRRGLGRILHAHRLAWAWREGARQIFLQTESDSVESWNRKQGWGEGPELVGWGPGVDSDFGGTAPGRG